MRRGRPEPRFLTVEEVQAVLPEVRSLLQEMDGHVGRGREARDLRDDLEEYWGEDVRTPGHPEHAEWTRLRDQMEAAREGLDACLRGLHELGAHLKSYEAGLVDFYARRDGRPVFLCWQRGEPSVGHYHDLEAGFAGREPLEPEPSD